MGRRDFDRGGFARSLLIPFAGRHDLPDDMRRKRSDRGRRGRWVACATMPEATTQKLLEAKAAGIDEHLGTARRGHPGNSKLRPRGKAEPLKAPGP